MMVESRKQARVQVIVFTLNQLRFAVPIEQVWRVEPLADQTLTRVPRAPTFLEGVVNVRGQVVPILELKRRFALDVGERPPKARLLIVEMEGQRVGLIVDTVSDILWLPTDKIVSPPAMVAQISGVFIQGVAKLTEEDLLIILDLREVLSPAERQALNAVDLPTG